MSHAKDNESLHHLWQRERQAMAMIMDLKRKVKFLIAKSLTFLYRSLWINVLYKEQLILDSRFWILDFWHTKAVALEKRIRAIAKVS